MEEIQIWNGILFEASESNQLAIGHGTAFTENHITEKSPFSQMSLSWRPFIFLYNDFQNSVRLNGVKKMDFHS
jgi:hypothetical protein